MARKTIFVSDLTGRTIDENDAATVTIRYARRSQRSGRARCGFRRSGRSGGEGNEASAAGPQTEELASGGRQTPSLSNVLTRGEVGGSARRRRLPFGDRGNRKQWVSGRRSPPEATSWSDSGGPPYATLARDSPERRRGSSVNRPPAFGAFGILTAREVLVQEVARAPGWRRRTTERCCGCGGRRSPGRSAA